MYIYLIGLLAVALFAVSAVFRPVEMVTDPRPIETDTVVELLKDNGIRAKKKPVQLSYSTPNGTHKFNSYRITVSNKDYKTARSIIRNNTKGIVLDYSDKRDYDK